MAEARMLVEIAATYQEAVKKAEYLASDEYKQATLAKMRDELSVLMQLYTAARKEASAKAKLEKTSVTTVCFEAKSNTSARAFRLLQAQLSDYVVHVHQQDYWDDMGYHVTDYDVTVCRPL